MTTQPPDLKKLREVAERATPGPWHTTDSVGNGKVYVSTDGRESGDVCLARTEEISEFIATFNPQTILALLDAYEASARDAERYRTLLKMIDPDKVPGGFTLYYAIKEGTDQLIYDSDLAEILDASRHATQGD